MTQVSNLMNARTLAEKGTQSSVCLSLPLGQQVAEGKEGEFSSYTYCWTLVTPMHTHPVFLRFLLCFLARPEQWGFSGIRQAKCRVTPCLPQKSPAP